MTAANAKETSIHIRTLFYLEKCAVENGLLKKNLIATVRCTGVHVFDSKSWRLESVPLVSLGPIAPTKVLRPTKSSFGLIALANGLHQPLSFFETMFLDTGILDNNSTAPFLTTQWTKCAAASTLTKATSTATCSVFPLSVVCSAVPAEHDQNRG